MKSQDLVNYLDQYLRTREIRDASMNGLQVQGDDTIGKIGFAVDACVASIDAARAAGVNFLIVHHGLFWGKPEPITGSHYARVRLLIESGMGLYCSHLPLDAHPEVGNNAQIASKLGLEIEYFFGDYQGTPIAVFGRSEKKTDAESLHEQLKTLLGDHVRMDAFGPKKFRNIGICSGAGASLIPEARRLGMDAFITGEPRHSTYHFTREEGVHAYYGNHYDTETFGLQALAEHLDETFELESEFFDFPSGI